MQPSSQQRPPLQSSSSRNLSPEQQPTHRGGLSIPTGTAASATTGSNSSVRLREVCQGHRKPGCHASAVNNKLTCCRPPHHSGLGPRPPWGNVPPDKAKGQSEISLEKFLDQPVVTPSSSNQIFVPFSLWLFSLAER